MKFSLFAFVFLLLLFFFTRLYAITDSFLYLNDMGRDSLVLLDWQEAKKPPLLGPQTSALPFNQSAVYFYLLYPMFLLTQGSPFAAVYTLDIYYVVIFSLTFLMVYRTKQKDAMIIFLCSLLLMIFHPQFIIQNRFVWNPSFVGPLILFSYFAFYFLTQHFTRRKIVALGGALALATSLSYSVIPIVIGFGVASIYFFRKKCLWIGVSLAAWLAFFNLPTLLFELRHHFLLTQMMLNQPKVKQVNIDLPSKMKNIFDFMFTAMTPDWERVLAAFFAFFVLVSAFIYWKMRNQKQSKNAGSRSFLAAFVILAVGVAMTMVLPIPILAHYIFGVVVLGCILIATFPVPLRNGIMVIFIGMWAFSFLNQQYTKPAVRTVSQMESCYRNFCLYEKEPLFVSMQSGLLPFHNGPEHRYLLKKAGCTVKDIETEAGQADTMAIVVESSEFQFGQTDYNELSAFGPKKLGKTYTCQDNLQVVTVTH